MRYASRPIWHAQALVERVTARTAELVAANKELEAFSYSISHDLRSPLRAIDGFARILQEDYAVALPDAAQRYVQLMRDNAQQMGHLIDDLLAFSRLSRHALARRPVDPATLVRQCLEELQAEQAGRAIDIQIGALPACQGDGALLKQVWINLLANALKYTRTARPGGDRDRLPGGGQRSDDLLSSKITVWALICAIATNCLVCSSGCIAPRTTKAPAWDWQLSSGSSSATAGGSGPRPIVDQGATFSFTLEGDRP